MANGTVEVLGNELKDLLKELESNENVKLMLKALKKYGKIKDDQSSVIEAGKSQPGDTNIAFMVMGFNEDKVKVVTIKTDNGIQVFASSIENEGGEEVLKGFKVVNNKIEDIFSRKHDEKFKQALKELDTREFKEPAKTDKVRVDIPCIYGNWCGPGCSGPADPINDVDACCQSHDHCYDSLGYFSCTCDANLQECLAPYVARGNKWAIVISGWFSIQPCK
jgi:hypothetical protein